MNHLLVAVKHFINVTTIIWIARNNRWPDHENFQENKVKVISNSYVPRKNIKIGDEELEEAQEYNHLGEILLKNTTEMK